MSEQKNKTIHKIQLAMRQAQIEDEELVAVCSEAGQSFDGKTIDGLIGLIQEFGRVQKEDDERMEQELTKIILTYRKKIIDGRRSAIKKAVKHLHQRKDEKKIRALNAKIKKKQE